MPSHTAFLLPTSHIIGRNDHCFLSLSGNHFFGSSSDVILLRSAELWCSSSSSQKLSFSCSFLSSQTFVLGRRNSGYSCTSTFRLPSPTLSRRTNPTNRAIYSHQLTLKTCIRSDKNIAYFRGVLITELGVRIANVSSPVDATVSVCVCVCVQVVVFLCIDGCTTSFGQTKPHFIPLRSKIK